MLYIIIFVLGTAIISLEGIDFESSAGAVAATLGNIGPGIGLVGPARTYSQFSYGGEIVVIFAYVIREIRIIYYNCFTCA